MQFHLNFTPQPFSEKINYRHRLLLIGSCFTENMGSKLRQHKFSVLENPHGILFNPHSICTALADCCEEKKYRPEDLFYYNEGWHSWNHHSRFSSADANEAVKKINDSIHVAHDFIITADYLLITLGSSFVYRLQPEMQMVENKVSHQFVANCHKVPTDKFTKVMLSTTETVEMLSKMQEQVKAVNPKVKFIYTISPVRHLRDGFVENNRSKAALISAVHQLVEANKNCHYFPAYELVIDDLRDYRFYAEDLVHPNYAATNYVWEKFLKSCMDENTLELIKELQPLINARNHKPFNAHSAAHENFRQTFRIKAEALQNQYPGLDLREEIAYFGI